MNNNENTNNNEVSVLNVYVNIDKLPETDTKIFINKVKDINAYQIDGIKINKVTRFIFSANENDDLIAQVILECEDRLFDFKLNGSIQYEKRLQF